MTDPYLSEENSVFDRIPKVAGDKPGMVRSMLPIFMYHHVSDESLRRVSSKSMLISPARFEQQMCFLSKNGFRCLSLSEVVANWQQGKRQPDRSFALTFDDGYADIYENAAPILKNLGYSATIFVVVQPVTEGDARFLTWPVMRELAQNSFTFGSHTMTHPRLGSLDNMTIKRELDESKKVIEDKLGRPVDLLAYPYGDSNVHIQEMACELGYRAACGVTRGYLTRFNLWRVPISEHESGMTFWWKALGWHSTFTWLREETYVARIVQAFRPYIKGA